MKTKADSISSDFLRAQPKLSPEKSFHFWTKAGYLGIKADSLNEFLRILEYIEIESLNYHIEKNDFENWITYELEKKDLANMIAKLKKQKAKGERLRQNLKEIITLYSINEV